MYNIKVSGGNEGAKIHIKQTEKDGFLFADVTVTLPEEASPEKIKFEWQVPTTEFYSVWGPLLKDNRSISPCWSKRRSDSRLAVGMPLLQIISKKDINRICFASSDPATPMSVAAGIHEEDALTDFEIELFTNLTAPLKEYKATWRFDMRPIPYYDAIYDVVNWWENDLGFKPAYVPDAAKMPMDSLWYSFHQVLDVESIVEECRLAKPLGMDTVIIDDGWQTEDNSRGYAYCGDWQVAHSKMGDMKELVDRLHEIDIKVMLWYSVPFVGIYSKKYEEFKGFLRNAWGDRTAFALDPRYKVCRDYLVNTYTTAVKEWGLDGLKLDFIDSFKMDEEGLKPDDRRDYISLEEAIDALMTEVKDKLTAINPEILIEFRQSYVGPAIRKYGNMLRVTDCPSDSLFNRRGVIDLRFTSGKTAVHSDMVMWNAAEGVEAAAMQIASVIYGVPQISVKLCEMPDEHIQMVRHYLDFWRKNRDVLLDGKLTATEPWANYSLACATLGEREIISAYADRFIECKVKESVIVNCTSADSLIIKGCKGRDYTVVDCIGNKVSEGKIDSDLFEIEMPLCSIFTAK